MKFIDYSRNYERAFHFDGMNYFITDVFIVFYAEVDAMVTAIQDNTRYWFPKDSIEKMLDEGAHFFADQEAFDSYHKAHLEFLHLLKQTYDSEIVNSTPLTLEGVQKFLTTLPQGFRYFYKTEYFYVDKAYALSKFNPVIKENIRRNYVLKEKARVEFLNNSYFGENAYMNVLFRKLEAQFGVPEKDLSRYGIQDICNLFDGKRLSADLIESRCTARVIFAKDKALHSYTGQEAKEEIIEFLGKTGESLLPTGDVLKGIPASKGKTIGRVKVIISDPSTFDSLSREFEKMQKGDVLVAETTSPEFMPACRKAGAILANQGGLLSHAAVVSREFGIPAVVGLKYATQVLKDGDVVEVDGNTGTVRIIERA